MDSIYWLVPTFFIVALVYSTAGFGGGSSYLALLALAGMNTLVIPSYALVCNLIVASSSFYFFRKAGHFSLRGVAPFIVSSIPLAYWGGTLNVSRATFTIMLVISLLVAAVRLLISDRSFATLQRPSLSVFWPVALPIGSAIGLWSGVVGIGGGILLSPVVMLLGWADAKQAAGLASFFILVNSASGLMGQLSKGFPDWSLLIPLAVAVSAGGLIGSRMGSVAISRPVLQRITAVLLFAVALRLAVFL